MNDKGILISGGCGFIGHHMVEHFLKTTNWHIFIVDKLTYAATGFDRVRDINAYDNDRVTIFTADITRPISRGLIDEMEGLDYILHLSAETHVDNSIKDPIPFVMSNVVGTMHILNFARTIKNLKAMVYFSTDEVFGPAIAKASPTLHKDSLLNYKTLYKEWDRYNSTNPYSASKAGGEELCLAYANTYGLPLFITHTMNAIGERQHPEKFVPLCIRKILAGEQITIHADKTKTKSGTRFYIHCRNIASAVHFLLDKFDQRDKYNIVGEKELSNLKLAQIIAKIIGTPLYYKMVDFHSSRPGHDLRYALDGTKMEELGWRVPLLFEESLTKTVEWTLENRRWL